MVVAPFDMDGWLGRTRIVVCVGAGGVGKTTTAATLGLAGALRGRKVMVLTIDPARRLANSLGLKEFGNEETRIDLHSLGVEAQPGGELWAMMLDSRSTFDSLIARIAPNEVLIHRADKLRFGIAYHGFHHFAAHAPRRTRN